MIQCRTTKGNLKGSNFTKCMVDDWLIEYLLNPYRKSGVEMARPLALGMQLTLLVAPGFALNLTLSKVIFNETVS